MATPIHQLYPTFLRLDGRRVLLVGGGTVATAKLGALLGAGADLTVVAPDIAPAIRDAADLAPLRLARRPFAPDDLDTDTQAGITGSPMFMVMPLKIF